MTIPKALRDDLGLTTGCVLDFTEGNGRMIVIERVSENPISAWRGKAQLPAGTSVDGYLRMIRDES